MIQNNLSASTDVYKSTTEVSDLGGIYNMFNI